jgi:dihydroflavonol-4-reductase
MRALVTGANGLIGCHVLRELQRAGHEVRGLVRARSDLRSLAALDIPLVRGDVLDPSSLDAAVRDCDLVFHCAAVFGYWGITEAALEEIAVDGTRHVLEAAARAGVRRVVLTSSSVVCGSGPSMRVRNEFDVLDDEAAPAYDRVKQRQEVTAFRAAAELGLELVAVLPTLTVGANDYRLVPSNALIVNYLRDPFRLSYPGGVNVVSARDVARGHWLAGLHGRAGARYLLGGENLEYSLLYRHVSELCGLPGPLAQASRTAATLAAGALELLAVATGEAPPLTRAQARTLGRFFWYSHERASEIGYAPRGARRALAEAIGWLVTSPHVTNAMRRRLRLSSEVYEARHADLPAYREALEAGGSA